MGLFFNENINTLFVGSNAVKAVYMGDTLVWPTGLPVGTVFNFEYTGSVQSVELPPGKYKLQCWGAQGGRSYKSSSYTGSKGGYSEGILSLNETKTIYIFVGGLGSYGSSTSVVNGGWNGGGGSVGYCSYGTGYSYPACGGGATDMCIVTSSMSYSNGITNRSSSSLLSRFIVAGGGAGSSYTYYTQSSSSTSYSTYGSTGTYFCSSTFSAAYNGQAWAWFYFPGTDLAGKQVRITIDNATSSNSLTLFKTNSEANYSSDKTSLGLSSSNTLTMTKTLPSDIGVGLQLCVTCYGEDDASTSGLMPSTCTIEIATTTTTSTPSSAYANTSKQGGGVSGKGNYPGTQSSGGNSSYTGGFGYGATLKCTNYTTLGGGAGGGWYGGGCGYTDYNTTAVNYSGGGSGFVNTAANASYRPSGYTGLQLDSGTTIAGNTSHPSTSGGTETGHSGNGYARITVINSNGSYVEPEPSYSINWETKSGTWNSNSNSSAADGISYTCVSPGTSGSTVLRCTFSGITSITFNCVYNGENNYDYLTVGNLDSSCTRSSYGTTLKGTSGTAKDITFTCDSGTHYVEFCYSKDSSVDTSPDNATVYVKTYS